MLLQQLFIESAKKNMKKIAVYDKATGKEMSYSTMLIASLILAEKFKTFKGKHIGIMLPTSAGCHLGVLGALMCGKIPVMINYSTGAIENAIYAQEKCSFKTIIVSKKLLQKLNLKPIKGMIALEDMMKEVTAIDKIKAAARSKLPSSLLKAQVGYGKPDESSVILFTSGSEKDPKAVQLSHNNIMHNLRNLPKILNFGPKDVFAGTLPLFHVFGLTTNFWLPYSVGASIVTHANPLDYRNIVKSIVDHKISVLIGTPTFFHGYLKRAKKGDFSSVRLAMAGADKLNEKLRLTYLHEHDLEILEGYGATETSPVVSVNTNKFNRPGSIGKPLPETEVRIIDRLSGDVLPPNKIGKIEVKGDLITLGYYGDLEETYRSIRGGWYDTGDMGLLDEDGYLWHKGRLKRFVKIGGEMVSLVKVEEVLAALLPEDVICCVVDVPNPTKGADIVAAVTTGEINKKQIIKAMKKALPAIAIPKEFHVIEDIPLMGSGKVAFREVEKICRALEAEEE